MNDEGTYVIVNNTGSYYYSLNFFKFLVTGFYFKNNVCGL